MNSLQVFLLLFVVQRASSMKTYFPFSCPNRSRNCQVDENQEYQQLETVERDIDTFVQASEFGASQSSLPQKRGSSASSEQEYLKRQRTLLDEQIKLQEQLDSTVATHSDVDKLRKENRENAENLSVEVEGLKERLTQSENEAKARESEAKARQSKLENDFIKLVGLLSPALDVLVKQEAIGSSSDFHREDHNIFIELAFLKPPTKEMIYSETEPFFRFLWNNASHPTVQQRLMNPSDTKFDFTKSLTVKITFFSPICGGSWNNDLQDWLQNAKICWGNPGESASNESPVISSMHRLLQPALTNE